jgi:hypothetical protein
MRKPLILLSPNSLEGCKAQRLACLLLNIIKEKVKILLAEHGVTGQTGKLFNLSF